MSSDILGLRSAQFLSCLTCASNACACSSGRLAMIASTLSMLSPVASGPINTRAISSQSSAISSPFLPSGVRANNPCHAEYM